MAQNGKNPVENALSGLEREFGKVRKQIETRTRDVEKRLAKGRKQIETRSRKQLRSIASEVRKNPVVKRAEALRKDAEKQLETGVESVLGFFQIASKSDVSDIDRKLNSLNKKLSGLEKDKSPGRRPAQI
jgi:tRNA G18 (ribose-2'-O)-methylase SpoU